MAKMIHYKRLLYFFIAAILITWITFYTYHKYLQSQVREESQIRAKTGIDRLDKIKLGGVEQWILIRSWDISNPILLFLHGGPGALLFTYAREIGVGAKLEKDFLMVYWEQRGCGKSYSPAIKTESLSIEQLISDTHELCNYLCQRFNRAKIILVARSFGSLVGIRIVQRIPELFHAYIGIAQMIEPLRNDSLAYRFTLRTAKEYQNKKAIKELEKIGGPPYNYEQLLMQRKWLTIFSEKILTEKFGRYHQDNRTKLLSTPEYSLLDLIKIGFDPTFSLRSLWNEQLYNINLNEEIRSLQVPVFFICGKYDYYTSKTLLEHFYTHLEAVKGKKIFWFEYSGHEPEQDEPEKFNKIMVDNILTISQ
jgi:pimeloyl-ACP methyl ester carboxylesterase